MLYGPFGINELAQDSCFDISESVARFLELAISWLLFGYAVRSVGGFVGVNEAQIEDSSFEGEVVGEFNVVGIAGRLRLALDPAEDT